MYQSYSHQDYALGEDLPDDRQRKCTNYRRQTFIRDFLTGRFVYNYCLPIEGALTVILSTRKIKAIKIRVVI